jgi:hypothetical protein
LDKSELTWILTACGNSRIVQNVNLQVIDSNGRKLALLAQKALLPQAVKVDFTAGRKLCHIYGRSSMKPESVRTTVDIPAPLYRRLKAQAAAQGCSARELILRGMERVVLNPRQPARQRVQFPLIRSQGPKVRLSNQQMYEHVEFP